MAKNAQAEMITIGLQDEGGMVDEASGNEVPNGALKEEVRDDQPAMLSPGEFVIPAYAVRYFGVERFVKMLRAAKQGMEQLDDMGLTGEPNADDASLETAMLPTEVDKDVSQFQVGGYQPGGVTRKKLTLPEYTSPVVAAATTPAVAPSPVTAIAPPTAPVRPAAQQTVNYEDFVRGGGGYGVAEYVGPQGQAIFVTTIGGKPISQIPEGFKTRAQYNKDKAAETDKPAAPPSELKRKPEDMDPGSFEASEGEGEGSDLGNFSAENTTNSQIQSWANFFGDEEAESKDEDVIPTLAGVITNPVATLGTKALEGIFSFFTGKSKEDQATKFMTRDNKFMAKDKWEELSKKQKQKTLEDILSGKFNPGYVEGEAGSVAPSESLLSVQTEDPSKPGYISAMEVASGALTGRNVVVNNTASKTDVPFTTDSSGRPSVNGDSGAGEAAAADAVATDIEAGTLGDIGDFASYGDNSGSNSNESSGNSMEGVGRAEGGFIKKKTRKRKPRGKGLASSM